MSSITRLLRLLGSCVVVIATLWAAHGPLATALPAPPTSPAMWPAFVDHVGAAEVVMRLARLALVATAWWSALVLGLALVAVIGGHVAPLRVALRWSPSPLRRILAPLAVGMALTPTAAFATVVAPSPVPPPVTMAVIEAATAPEPALLTMEAAGIEPLPLPPAPQAPDVEAPPTAAPPATPAPTEPTTGPAVVAAPGTHVVERGEHFWSVARDVVTDRTGREPSEREIAPFWLRLIEANRDRLVDPARPDLVFPGQVLVLPDA